MASKKAKIRRIYQPNPASVERKQLFARYDDKYFNLWLSNYKWTGIDRQAADFVMRRLWDTGIVACYSLPIIKEPAFTTFSEQTRDQYWYPATGHLINQNGQPETVIPSSKLMTVDKDVVLLYALRTFTPFRFYVEKMIEKIVEVEMVIRTNLYALRNPLLIPVSPEEHDRAQDTINRINNDEPTIFTDIDPTNIKTIIGIPNNIAAFYQYKTQLENELLTYMGIDNIGTVEKKERLVTDEANSNNAIINDYGDDVLRNLTEFCDKAKEVLGFDISVESTGAPAEAMQEEQQGGTEDDK